MTWIDDAKEAIRASTPQSSVYIGADSIRFKKKGVWYAKFTTVIVVHRDSRHGCQIFHNSVIERDFGNLRQRMLTEVGHAVAAASEIVDVLGERRLEVHIDVNSDPKHKSNIAAKEALGWVRGTLGIDAKIKPHSWAATHAADHAVRNLH